MDSPKHGEPTGEDDDVPPSGSPDFEIPPHDAEQRRDRRQSSHFLDRSADIVYFIGLPLLLLCLGGIIVLTMVDETAPASADSGDYGLAVTWLALTVSTVPLAGTHVFRRNRKKWAFGTIWTLILTVVVGLVCEVGVRFTTPPWPDCGLHGVPRNIAADAWGHFAADGSVGYNNWGQRDRNRSRTPSPSTFRVAFIGDSLLEESAGTPLALRVEQMIERTSFEAVNLGVSATGPEEYYYRAKNIAAPLTARHIVLFVFAGNDFAEPARTLQSFAGVAAVYPRDSLLASAGLLGLNHVLTNHSRPMLNIWFAQGNLYEQEQRLGALFAESDDRTARDYLLASLPRNTMGIENLAARLDDPQMAGFYQMLRRPDAGRFRSYYLWDALWSAASGATWYPLQEQFAFEWIGKTSQWADRCGIGLTIVLVPEAFQVDPRMCSQWKPLADMRALTQSCRDASRRFRDRALAADLDVIDLHETLDGVAGTYLNLDGHWSEKGVEIVAAALADHLSNVREGLDR